MQINKITYNHKIKSRTKKTGIVIHGTGGSSVEGCVNSFDPDAVSVPFIIDRDGKIYQLYDEAYDHYHAGAKFRAISKKTIGIELVNWNFLIKKNDGYYSWVNKRIDDNDVIKTDLWRGYTAFHNVTSEQHKSLCKLLKYLCEKYEIQKSLIRDYNQKLINNSEWSGICFHSSFHPEKTDFHPSVIKKISI